MRLARSLALAATVATVLASAACGGDDNSLEEGGDDTASTGGGSLTLASQAFPEAQIMTSMYEQLLTDAGFDVTTKLVDTRDTYAGELSKGTVDVVPEYLGGLADFLNTQANGDTAKPITTSDADETLQALEPLAAESGITMLDPAEASAQNAFFVTQDYADKNSLTTLTDLGALGEPVKLAAAPDCEGRADCEKGLREVYKIDISEVVPLGYATAQTFDAVLNGEVELGQTGTTDGTLADQGLVLLEDDKGIQPAQNLIPAVNSEFLDAHPELADTLNPLMQTLTTDDLVGLNAQVSVERQKPEDVAKSYLEDKGLL